MNKKIVIGCFLVVILMLLISFETAVSFCPNENFDEKDLSIKNNKLLNIDAKRDVYIDSDIYLTNKILPDLKKAIQSTKDFEINLLLQKIVDCLEKKGLVKSDDIQSFVVELQNQQIKVPQSIYSGNINGEGPGQVWIPGGLKFIGPAGALWFAVLPHLIFWEAVNDWHRDIDVQVGNTHINEPHNGLGIGFVGFAEESYIGIPFDPWILFGINGAAPIIIVY